MKSSIEAKQRCLVTGLYKYMSKYYGYEDMSNGMRIGTIQRR